MDFKKLLQLYLTAKTDQITTGTKSKIRSREIHALRDFSDWADANGYILAQPIGPNGAAFFCKNCGVYLSGENAAKT